MSKFRHLMSIKESSEFKDNIDIVNDIEDVFRFLSDDMDFDIESYFIETFKSESGTEKRKYDGEGDLVLRVLDPGESEPKTESKIWLLSGNGTVTSDKILEICQEINKSINLISSMLHLETILNKSTIGFYYEGYYWPSVPGAITHKSFYFDDIEDDEDILNDVIMDIKVKSKVRTNISIQFVKELN